ncbi:MAG: adenosylmethionine--8-amino-7-oxononanoate transaminase, partial [Planctomycetota bacterium]
RKFLDAFGSMWCNVFGHCHPDLTAAIQEQVGKLCHSSLFSVTHAPAVEFARQLVDAIKEDFRFADNECSLNHVFYSDNGSTAVEVAMKMALQYQNQKGKIGRTQFLTFTDAYHGDTFGAMSVGKIEAFKRMYSPSLFETFNSPYPVQVDPDERAEGIRNTAMQLEALISGRNDKIAAIVIEPVLQGAAGMRPLAEDYLGKLKKYCREYDILLITDEVFVGYYRTGRLVASSAELVEPDILCMGKGVTGGTMGMGVTVANNKVYGAFEGEWSEMKQFLHGHTYSGNPIACAAAIKTLELIKETRLAENVKSRAREFSYELKRRIGSHERVGQIRQRGLAIGVPILDSKGRDEGGYTSRDDANKVCKRALEKNRVILRPLGNIITIVPPLSIERQQIDEIVDALETGLEALHESSDTPDEE